MNAFRYRQLRSEEKAEYGDLLVVDGWDPNNNTSPNMIIAYKKANSGMLPIIIPVLGFAERPNVGSEPTCIWRIEVPGAEVTTSEPANDHRKIEMEL